MTIEDEQIFIDKIKETLLPIVIYMKEEQIKKIRIAISGQSTEVALADKKPKAEPVVPDVQTQMEKADKIESYRAKKDVAWHKTEYNKVLKYLNKKK